VNQDPAAEQKFRDISEAYEVLQDSEKRKAYDQFGSNWKAGQKQPDYNHQPRYAYTSGNEGGGGFDFGGGFADAGHYSDFFESLFGGRYRRGGYEASSFTAAERVKKVQHLQRDLGVNLPGAALALYLLDRIAQLESCQRKKSTL